jgi:hypothetical protein
MFAFSGDKLPLTNEVTILPLYPSSAPPCSKFKAPSPTIATITDLESARDSEGNRAHPCSMRN